MDDTVTDEELGLFEEEQVFKFQDQVYRRALENQAWLLRKLNRADLVCLAKHFKIKDVRFYTEPGDWQHGGKEELVLEIASIMVDEP